MKILLAIAATVCLTACPAREAVRYPAPTAAPVGVKLDELNVSLADARRWNDGTIEGLDRLDAKAVRLQDALRNGR